MASPKPLLNPGAAAPPIDHRRRAGFPWGYPELGFIPVAFNYGACLYRGGGDCGAYAYFFVVGLGVLLLFWLLRRSLRAPPGSAERARLKLAVWVVDTAVIAAGNWWLTAPPMPLRFAAPAWAVGRGIRVPPPHVFETRLGPGELSSLFPVRGRVRGHKCDGGATVPHRQPLVAMIPSGQTRHCFDAKLLSSAGPRTQEQAVKHQSWA